MKFLRPLPLTIMALCVSILTSCGDKLIDDDTPLPGLPVQTVEITNLFDLAQRDGWLLTVGGVQYDYSTENNILRGTASNSTFRFPYGAKNGSATMIFFPENYGKTRTPASVLVMDYDQGTLEKFTNLDVLIAEYTGEVSENITGIEFRHRQALIDFSVTNIPDDAVVYLIDKYGKKITPFRDEKDATHYMAIMTPQNRMTNTAIMIVTPEKEYVQPFSTTETRSGITVYPDVFNYGSIISFTATITEDNELKIEGLVKKENVKSWPISQ